MKSVWFNLLILMLLTVSGFAQTEWEKYAGNPVLSGTPGEWDEVGVIATNVLFDGTTYHMWYVSSDSWIGLGYATSTNGVNWTKHVTNPVFEVGPEGIWENATPTVSSIVLIDNTFHMWYGIWDETNCFIGYATSPDGITWTKHDSNPVFEPGPEGAWDDEGVLQSKVIYKDGIYYMWYTGWDGTTDRMGYATSSDGVNWTKYAGNPVLDIGPIDSWDAKGISSSSVVFNGTYYEMWYEGGDSLQVGTPGWVWSNGTGYATSSDGITWTKFEQNPLDYRGLCCEAWDAFIAFQPKVIFDGNKYQIWYSGLGPVGVDSVEFKIGYAESSMQSPLITSITDVPEDQGGWVYLSWVGQRLR